MYTFQYEKEKELNKLNFYIKFCQKMGEKTKTTKICHKQ